MATTLTIDFHGDPLLVIRDDARGNLVPLRPLVKGMKLDWSAQRRRVYRHPIMAKAVAIMATGPSDPDGLCLPLHMVPGFLFGVTSEKISDKEIRDKVEDYQRECFRVLAEACLGRAPRQAEVLPNPVAERPETLSIRMVSEARKTFGTSSSRALWFKLGLPVVAEMRPGSASPDLFTYSRES